VNAFVVVGVDFIVFGATTTIDMVLHLYISQSMLDNLMKDKVEL